MAPYKTAYKYIKHVIKKKINQVYKVHECFRYSTIYRSVSELAEQKVKSRGSV